MHFNADSVTVLLAIGSCRDSGSPLGLTESFLLTTNPPYSSGFRRFLAAVKDFIDTPLGIATLAAFVYFLSSFVSISNPSRGPDPPPGEWAKRYSEKRYVMLSLPRIVRGDEMHYLMVAYSLAQDGDLLISDDYASVMQGGYEMGYWHRYQPVYNLFQHFGRRTDGALLNNHPFGFSLVIALCFWPLAHTPYMEAASIWLTVMVAFVGLWVFSKILLLSGFRWKHVRLAALIVAFATPYWHYARTLYTEAYVATGYLILVYCLMRSKPLLALPVLFVLSWYKYTVFLMYLSAGVAELCSRRFRYFFIFGFFGVAVLVMVGWFNATWYKDASWYVEGKARQEAELSTATNFRKNLTANAPINFVGGHPGRNLLGVLIKKDKGLLPYTPLIAVLGFGLFWCWRDNRRLFNCVVSCLIPWSVLHVCYEYVLVGDSYTTRYLVPMIPLACLGLPSLMARLDWEWSWVPFGLTRLKRVWLWVPFAGLVGYSFLCNALSGVFSGIGAARTPEEMIQAGGRILWVLAGSLF